MSNLEETIRNFLDKAPPEMTLDDIPPLLAFKIKQKFSVKARKRGLEPLKEPQFLGFANNE